MADAWEEQLSRFNGDLLYKENDGVEDLIPLRSTGESCFRGAVGKYEGESTLPCFEGRVVCTTDTRGLSLRDKTYFFLGPQKERLFVASTEKFSPGGDLHYMKLECSVMPTQQLSAQVHRVERVMKVRPTEPTDQRILHLVKKVFARMALTSEETQFIMKLFNEQVVRRDDMPSVLDKSGEFGVMWETYHRVLAAIQAFDQNGVRAAAAPSRKPLAPVFATHPDATSYFAAAELSDLLPFYEYDWLAGLTVPEVMETHAIVLKNWLNPYHGLYRAFFYPTFSAEAPETQRMWTRATPDSVPVTDPASSRCVELELLGRQHVYSKRDDAQARLELTFEHALLLKDRGLVTTDFLWVVLFYELIKCAYIKWGHTMVTNHDVQVLTRWWMGGFVPPAKARVLDERMESNTQFFEREPRAVRKKWCQKHGLFSRDVGKQHARAEAFLVDIGAIVRLPRRGAVQLRYAWLLDCSIEGSLRALGEMFVNAHRGAEETERWIDRVPLPGNQGASPAHRLLAGENPWEFCSEQKAVLLAMVKTPFVIASGSAGSGKSRTGSALFGMLEYGSTMGIAFQGSHADSLRRSIRRSRGFAEDKPIPVSTIHNLLHWHGRTCMRNLGLGAGTAARRKKCTEDGVAAGLRSSVFRMCRETGHTDLCMLETIKCVVIDEGGVLFEALFAKLMLVLVGCCPNLRNVLVLQDPNQLPPVVGGRLGSELAIGMGSIPLWHCHRATSGVLQTLHTEILAGRVPKTRTFDTPPETFYHPCKAKFMPNDEAEDSPRAKLVHLLMHGNRYHLDELYNTLFVTRTNRMRQDFEHVVASVMFLEDAAWRIKTLGQKVNVRAYVSPKTRLLNRDFFQRAHWVGKVLSTRFNDAQMSANSRSRVVVTKIVRGRASHLSDAKIFVVMGRFMAQMKAGLKAARANCGACDMNQVEEDDVQVALETVRRRIRDVVLMHRSDQGESAHRIARFLMRRFHPNEVSVCLNDGRTARHCFVQNALTHRELLRAAPPMDSEMRRFTDTHRASQFKEIANVVRGDALPIDMDHEAFNGCLVRHIIQNVVGDVEDIVLDDDVGGPTKRALQLFFKDLYERRREECSVRLDQFLHFEPQEELRACLHSGAPYVPGPAVGTKRAKGGPRGWTERGSAEETQATFLVCHSLEDYLAMRRGEEPMSEPIYLPCTKTCMQRVDAAGVVTFYSAQSQEAKTAVVLLPSPATRSELYTAVTRGAECVHVVSNSFALTKSVLQTQCVRRSHLAARLSENVRGYVETRLVEEFGTEVQEFVAAADAALEADARAEAELGLEKNDALTVDPTKTGFPSVGEAIQSWYTALTAG